MTGMIVRMEKLFGTSMGVLRIFPTGEIEVHDGPSDVNRQVEKMETDVTRAKEKARSQLLAIRLLGLMGWRMVSPDKWEEAQA